MICFSVEWSHRKGNRWGKFKTIGDTFHPCNQTRNWFSDFTVFENSSSVCWVFNEEQRWRCQRSLRYVLVTHFSPLPVAVAKWSALRGGAQHPARVKKITVISAAQGVGRFSRRGRPFGQVCRGLALFLLCDYQLRVTLFLFSHKCENSSHLSLHPFTHTV